MDSVEKIVIPHLRTVTEPPELVKQVVWWLATTCRSGSPKGMVLPDATGLSMRLYTPFSRNCTLLR